MTGTLDAMQPGAMGPQQITEEDVAASAPRVRALLVARLEAMWEPVRVRLEQDKDGEFPMDPRLLEIGLRIVKEEAMHYRLFRPPAAEREDDEPVLGAGVDRAALLESKLVEVESRLRSGGQA